MYIADKERYNKMKYNRCGNSGLKLPAIALGLWHNFGSCDKYDNMVNMLTTAFDLGITHFDLANNYGPYPGAAEENFGKIFKDNFKPYRDELIISTKAGYRMWPGPYGEWGSRKYLLSSLDASLKRMGLDYVDIFYSHRFDPETPLEETMGALATAVKSGKALYAGISSYSAEDTDRAIKILRDMGVPLLIHQPSYSMMDRWIEGGLQDVLDREKVGSIAFCPLHKGVLTDRYLNGIPEDSRWAKNAFTSEEDLLNKIEKVKKLNVLAQQRGQTVAQMALAWNLRGGRLTSVLIGASRPQQIIDNVKAIDNLEFTKDELEKIEEILKG